MLESKFDPKEAEKRLYKMWEDSGAFKPRAAKETDTKDDNFSIVIPPPNVTGSLHMGHAVNNTIQDILVRYNRMKGKAVLWQPGTDHAGIATQMVVERKLAAEGKARKDMTREEFLGHVWNWKAESGGNINQQLRRLGSSCDWSREKFTLGNPDDETDKMAEAVTKAFVEMYEAGLIYRDKRLVNWDPHFQTAISDLEVENIEKDGHFWHFKYPLEGGETYTYVEKDEDGNITLTEERDYISIATTRPETMLGDGAVAVHPDDERYAPIVGKMVRLPLANRLIPIITDEYPDMDFGSGAVKITGAHDFNDYEVAKRNDIPMYSLMDEKGAMCASEIMPEKYVGMDRFKARKAVVADIDAEGLLIKIEDKKIMQPYGDRSGVVIEPMLTDQWFVAADKLAEQAMAKVDDGSTKFIPENWKKTYDHWMKEIQPWCISRQLWWGHQIPAWYIPSYGNVVHQGEVHNLPSNIIVASNKKDAVKAALNHFSILGDIQENIDPVNYDENSNDYGSEDFLIEIIRDGQVSASIEVKRDPDVLDTWFSSGLWPFSTLGWPENTEELERFYPTSVLVTAFDIIFFWVARMMMQGLHFMKDEDGNGVVPFNDVYIHALVLDEQGKKMSKSIGNTLDPLDLIDGVSADDLVEKRTRGLKNPEKAPQIAKATRKQYPDGFEAYGADALRFTLASMAGQGRNIRLSVDRIAGYRNFGTKLWSAANFGQMNQCRPNNDYDVTKAIIPINQWIVSETAKTAQEVSRCIEAYRFNDAADAVYKFAWDTFCSWYLELTKPLLSGAEGTAKEETQAVFAWVLDQILKLLHPFMPFITEEIWLKIDTSRDDNLIVTAWPELDDTYIKPQSIEEIEWLQTLITNIRSVRADMNIPPAKKAALLMLAKDLDPRLAYYAPQLSPMARVDKVETAEAAPQGALQTVVDGVTYAIPLEGLIDLEAERKRLSKEIEKAQAEIDKIDKKLSNPAFTDKAPEKVVQLQKDRRADYASEIEKLQEAISGLG
ncbi:valyl-tRNA synthetase [Litorimonas taeanensis]|uniref:Valine--tRNA ligase n=1 Tax=Litorimonas taeanensis TaxID=568099 RepID=A0A420WL40_9PROT|nr:valine--tRNA ligase [Litorimonas taeanensis]RKQ71743.1 valyl-tRNA synthetase [Litorimonas taeanensis]